MKESGPDSNLQEPQENQEEKNNNDIREFLDIPEDADLDAVANKLSIEYHELLNKDRSDDEELKFRQISKLYNEGGWEHGSVLKSDRAKKTLVDIFEKMNF